MLFSCICTTKHTRVDKAAQLKGNNKEKPRFSGAFLLLRYSFDSDYRSKFLSHFIIAQFVGAATTILTTTAT